MNHVSRESGAALKHAIVPGRRVNKAWIVEFLVQRFCGPGVRLVLYGDLSRTMDELGACPGSYCHNPPGEIRASFRPPDETNCRVTVPTEQPDVIPRLRDIFHRVGIAANVHHIEILRGTERLFTSYDRWEDYLGVSEMSTEELWEMVDNGLLRAFGSVELKPFRFIPAQRNTSSK